MCETMKLALHSQFCNIVHNVFRIFDAVRNLCGYNYRCLLVIPESLPQISLTFSLLFSKYWDTLH